MRQETVAAISSGQVPAAIGVIRMTGPDAVSIVGKLLRRPLGKARYMYRRDLYASETSDEVLDDVMICRYEGPHSYTGEDCVEINAHGGTVNMARILDALYGAGALPAAPGEFSRRAFMNGKLDLSQAEAVMDLIHAQTDAQCREARRQLSGSVSATVSALRALVTDALCAVEASIDFSQEEDLAPFPAERVRGDAGRVMVQIARLRRAHESYRPAGYRTVLLGRPNAGKSSLFNHFAGHERAIVTDVPGTTTDTIEVSVRLGGAATFLMTDTAGVTETADRVEAAGVRRAVDRARDADIILLLISPDDDGLLDDVPGVVPEFDRLVAGGRVIALRTKADLGIGPGARMNGFAARYGLEFLAVSVSDGTGLGELERRLLLAAESLGAGYDGDAIMTSARHVQLLDQANEALVRAIGAIDAGYPAEMVAADLHDAADSLGGITGAFASEEILNEIFSHFCIGK